MTTTSNLHLPQEYVERLRQYLPHPGAQKAFFEEPMLSKALAQVNELEFRL